MAKDSIYKLFAFRCILQFCLNSDRHLVNRLFFEKYKQLTKLSIADFPGALLTVNSFTN